MDATDPAAPAAPPAPDERALIASAFALIAERGWSRLNLAEAARRADWPLALARGRIPTRGVLLLRFGRMADAHALEAAADPDAADRAPVRDRLFDLLMRRIDVLQAHRAGVLALLRAVPFDPPAALLLGGATLCSMGWMLEAAGVDARGPAGRLRAKGLLAVWLWTVRAWQRDATEDLAPTMAALDHALARAERAAGWLAARAAAPAADVPAAMAPETTTPETTAPEEAVPPAPPAAAPAPPEGPDHAQ